MLLHHTLSPRQHKLRPRFIPLGQAFHQTLPMYGTNCNGLILSTPTCHVPPKQVSVHNLWKLQLVCCWRLLHLLRRSDNILSIPCPHCSTLIHLPYAICSARLSNMSAPVFLQEIQFLTNERQTGEILTCWLVMWVDTTGYAVQCDHHTTVRCRKANYSVNEY